MSKVIKRLVKIHRAVKAMDSYYERGAMKLVIYRFKNMGKINYSYE